AQLSHWCPCHGGRVCFRQPYLAVGHAVETDAGPESNPEFYCAKHCLPCGAVRHVQNVAGLKLNVFRLAFHHFLEINVNLVLLSLSVLPNDDRMIAFRSGVQTPGESQHFQSSHLPAVIRQDETSGPRYRSEDLDNSRVGDGNDI